VGRKTNFVHIAVHEDTKKEVEELLRKLEMQYNKANYDEVIQILLSKNRNVIFSRVEIDSIMSKLRRVR
jgi:hypothetical protein